MFLLHRLPEASRWYPGGTVTEKSREKIKEEKTMSKEQALRFMLLKDRDEELKRKYEVI
jgi:peroxiredoxin